MTAVDSVIRQIEEQIINPLILLLFGVALLLFLWGGFEFIRGADSEEGRETGRRHMLWGIVGMFIMISVKGILNLVLGTFGVSSPVP